MENKSIRVLLIGFIALVLVAGAFSGGFLAGRVTSAGASVIAQPTPSAEASSGDLNTLFSPFWEAWDIVHQQYVEQPVDDTALMRGAISGMLQSLGDEHTSYMDPMDYQQANSPLQGEYDGIGAWVDTTGEWLTIISPMAGTPAERAGLKPGDKIIAVDGEDMTGVSPELVLRKVLGPAGKNVKLTIAREGSEGPLDVNIVREKIVMRSVESKMLDNNIAYVALTTFGDKSTEELKAALKDMLAKNPAGLVLDLRNNGGGYLDTAIQVVSQFVDDGVVMIEEYGDGRRQVFEALPNGLATKIPLVVLVNEGTASASEITAGAIQDKGRAPLVGTKTYGKGSVQNWIALKDDQGAVRVTIAHWLTPKERLIHKVGLTPDYVVELTEEDIKAGRDPQLDKAVDLLLNPAAK